MDSATEFLFGSDVKSLGAGLPYPSQSAAFPNSPVHLNNTDHPANRFSDAFAAALTTTAVRGRFGNSWALREFWQDRCLAHMKVVDSFIQPILRKAVENRRRGTMTDIKDVGENDTLLSHLVQYTQGTHNTSD